MRHAMNEVNSENWKELNYNVDSLWLINERDKSGKHSNFYHGNFVPQIPNQLIRRYTSEHDIVLELFSGSGTTLFECERLNRRYIGFDINSQVLNYVNSQMADADPSSFVLNNCDITDAEAFHRATTASLQYLREDSADFLIAHPPYLDIVKFTDNPCDLSNISDIDSFLEKLQTAFTNALQFLKKGGYFAIVMGDIYKNSEVVPLGFYTMNMINRNFKVKLKGIVVKNIEGNRGKLGALNIWKYRAMKSDYFLFKHEYIFVFKKMY